MDKISTIAGVILWWAEGTKSRRDNRWKNAITYPVEVTSTDPLAIQLFLKFIRDDLKVDENRVKLQIQIHENDEQKKLEHYWSKLTNIPLSRFNQTIIRPEGNKIGKCNGTCKIRYHDKLAYLKAKEILHKILSECEIG